MPGQWPERGGGFLYLEAASRLAVQENGVTSC